MATMTKDERFFWEHAGYSYNPKTQTKAQGRRETARRLATAEEHAAEQEWCFSWEWDDAGCSGCDCKSDDCACASGAEHETLGCVLRDLEGNVLASLWGICSPTPQYSRVVEAELAAEAQHNEHAATQCMAI